MREEMAGQKLAAHPGDLGVLERTTLEHYTAALSDFAMIDLAPVRLLLGEDTASSDSFLDQAGLRAARSLGAKPRVY